MNEIYWDCLKECGYGIFFLPKQQIFKDSCVTYQKHSVSVDISSRKLDYSTENTGAFPDTLVGLNLFQGLHLPGFFLLQMTLPTWESLLAVLKAYICLRDKRLSESGQTWWFSETSGLFIFWLGWIPSWMEYLRLLLEHTIVSQNGGWEEKKI